MVIAATGYGHGLEPLVGHLGVLTRPAGRLRRPAHPAGASGLYFNGYWLPLSGQLPAMRRTSRSDRARSRAMMRQGATSRRRPSR